MIKRWPGSDEIDYKLLKEIEDELVPTAERGKLKSGAFIDFTCLPTNDCEGALGVWENVATYTNAGRTGARYEIIQWARDECGYKVP